MLISRPDKSQNKQCCTESQGIKYILKKPNFFLLTLPRQLSVKISLWQEHTVEHFPFDLER